MRCAKRTIFPEHSLSLFFLLYPLCLFHSSPQVLALTVVVFSIHCFSLVGGRNPCFLLSRSLSLLCQETQYLLSVAQLDVSPSLRRLPGP